MILTFSLSILFTWGIGLAPAIIIRRFRSEALSRFNSNLISGLWCTSLAVGSFFLKAAAGEAHPRLSMAWFFVFWVSAFILRRPNAARRQEIIAELEAMASDENLDAERRVWAQEKLVRAKAKFKI